MSKIFEKNPTESIEWILAVRFWLRAMALTFPIALFLNTYGYLHYPTGTEISFGNALYHAAQLFILHAPHFEEPLPWYFEVGRWLAATSTILALVNAGLFLFYYEKENVEIWKIKKHTILCGLGEIGYALAKNYPDKRKLVIVEKDVNNENLTALRKLGAKRFKGNALDPAVLERVGVARATCLFALTGDDFHNLTILKTIRHLDIQNPDLMIAANIDSLNLKGGACQELLLCQRKKSQLESLITSFLAPATALLGVKEPESLEKLQNEFNAAKDSLMGYNPETSIDANDPGKSVRFFNVNELAARHIFRTYPPDRFRAMNNPGDQPMRILLLGYSQVGEELFKLMVQNCHYITREKTRITLISLDAAIIEEKVRNKHTQIPELFDLKFIQLNPHHITHTLVKEYDLRSTDVIYICALEDRFQSSYTMKAKEIFGKKIPVIRWFTKDVITEDEKSKENNVFTVEILKSVAKPELIISDSIDHQAIATHHRWLRRDITSFVHKVEKSMHENSEFPEPKPAMVPWYLLDEETKDDNRSVVEHNRVKIRTFNQLFNPLDFENPESAVVDFSFLIIDEKNKVFNEDNVRVLAEMEHRRWMATKYFYGWVYHEDRKKELKQHPDLVDFFDPRLSDGTREYDYQQIRELKEVWESGKMKTLPDIKCE